MPYIGYNVTSAGSFALIDDIASTFNGSNTAFTLQVGGVNITPNVQNLIISIDGVVQQAPDAYSVSGSTITFTEAPASGADFYGVLMGQSSYVENNSITADELAVSGDGSSGQLLSSDGDGTFSWLSSSSITSVGTLTTLQVGGQNSTPKIEWFYDHSNGNDYKANISLAGNDLEVRGSNGAMEFYTGAVDGASSTLALSINSSQNSTFAGNITQSASGNLRHSLIAGGSGEAVLLLQANNSTGDSFIRWETNATTFCMGFDNSDSDKFILSAGSDPHSNSVINIQPDGSSIAVDKPTSFNGNVTFAGGTTTLPVGGILRFGERGNLTHNSSNYNMTFNTNSLSNALVIAGDGKIGLNETNPAGKMHIALDNGTMPSVVASESALVLQNNSATGDGCTMTIISGTANNSQICFGDAGDYDAGVILYNNTNDHMTFRTNGSGEDMRIDSTGAVLFNTTTRTSTGNGGATFDPNSVGRAVLNLGSVNYTSEVDLVRFYNNNGEVGDIRTNGSGASFNSNSDYRLKENEVALSNALTRLNNLKPYRFNFKADPSTTLDGFFAHEVQEVVPEAVTGTKDQMMPIQYQPDDDIPEGKEVYDIKEYSTTEIDAQKMDASKLVPLLVASVQELSAKVEALENA